MMMDAVLRRRPSARRVVSYLTLSLLALIGTPLLSGCGSSSGESAPITIQLTPASQALSIWTIQTGRLTEYYMSLPAVPPTNTGLIYEPSLGLYYTISNQTSSGYTINYYLDSSKINPAGTAKVTASPPGAAYPKTVNIDNEIIPSDRVASFKGRVTLTYVNADRPSRITGSPALYYPNGRRLPTTFNLTPDPSTGNVNGNVSGAASVSGGQTQVATLLNNLVVAPSSGVMTGDCSVPGTTVTGTVTVDPFGTGIIQAVDPTVGRYSVAWDSSGVVTVTYLDQPGYPPFYVRWY